MVRWFLLALVALALAIWLSMGPPVEQSPAPRPARSSPQADLSEPVEPAASPDTVPGVEAARKPVEMDGAPLAAEEPSAAPAFCRVFGVVTDRDSGQLLANVRLGFLEHGEDWVRYAERTRSQPDGSFEFEVPEKVGTTLVARTDGYAIQPELQWLSELESFEWNPQLQRGLVVQGVVVDPVTGTGVEGVSVCSWDGVTELAQTDWEGRFAVRVWEHSESFLGFEKDASIRTGWAFDSDSLDPGLAYRIPLAGLGWFEGQVTAQGQALPSAEVVIERARGSFSEETLQATSAGAVPGKLHWAMIGPLSRGVRADGSYSIPVAASAEPQVILARSEDHSVAKSPPRSLQPGEVVRWDIDLQPGARVFGSVTKGGQPWFHGVVHLVVGERKAKKHLGRTGQFEFVQLPAGPAKIWIQDTRSSEEWFSEPVEFLVESGGRHELELEWTDDLMTISGRVVWPEGVDLGPIRSVAARTEATEESQMRWVGRDSLDPEGNFVIEVPEGATYEVHASFGLAGGALQKGVRPGTEGLELHVLPLRRLRLRAFDATAGKPVRLEHLTEEHLSWRRLPDDALRGLSSGTDPADPMGATVYLYRLRDGDRVELRLDLSERGYAPAVLEIPAPQLGGEGVPAVEFVLVPIDSKEAADGQLEDPPR